MPCSLLSPASTQRDILQSRRLRHETQFASLSTHTCYGVALSQRCNRCSTGRPPHPTRPRIYILNEIFRLSAIAFITSGCSRIHEASARRDSQQMRGGLSLSYYRLADSKCAPVTTFDNRMKSLTNRIHRASLFLLLRLMTRLPLAVFSSISCAGSTSTTLY